MERFYANLKNGLDKARALQEAKLFMIKKIGKLNPYFWAGFVLVGDK
jgi:CHAT domain-containing protein